MASAPTPDAPRQMRNLNIREVSNGFVISSNTPQGPAEIIAKTNAEVGKAVEEFLKD